MHKPAPIRTPFLMGRSILILKLSRVGPPAMQMNPLAGVALPARVLTYENPADMLAVFDIPADAPIVMKLTKVLGALTGKAVAE